jgi:NAD(P)-dependent dehydrogenase (short-subunit alcohol dehydrogenase family)
MEAKAYGWGTLRLASLETSGTTRPTIMVTGASSGIGAFCARALRDEGWRVLATARKPEDIAALEADGIEAFFLDYADEASIGACFDAVMARTSGRLDALFNNGAYSQAGAAEDVPTDALRAQFEANFFGWHSLTRRVVPVMRKQGAGRIVSVSSVLAYTPVQFRGAYGASKAALEMLMLCLRAELKGSGVGVSLIEPGPIRSKIAANGLAHFERHVDYHRSAHREAYARQLDRLRSGGTVSRFKLGPDAVHKVLRHALLSEHPRPHYVVTTPAKIAAVLLRVLPSSLFLRTVAKSN